MAQDVSEIDAAVAQVREALALDGAELLTVGVSAGRADFRLVLDRVTCMECVMPRQFIEDMTLMCLKERLPDIAAVRIEDPREAAV